MSWSGYVRRAAVGAGLLTLACAGETECDAIGCASGFEIHATSAGPLVDGLYRIELTLDELSGTCEVVVSASSTTTSCDELPVSVHPTPNGILVGILETPRSVTIRIDHETELLTEEHYEPQYETVRPAGPDCPVGCRIATDEEPYLSAAIQAARRRARESSGDSCDHLYDCGYWSENDRYRCRLMYADVRPSEEFERLIFEGRIAYDESSAEECRELGESCTLGKPGVCADLWEGTVPTGGACTTAVECAGLATCWYDADSEGTGTCEPMLEPGEPCTTADRCAAHGTENATCIDVNGEKQCRVSVPLPDAVEGSRCGAWLEGDELVQAGCVQEAFCNEEGICTTFFAPGEACELNGIGCGNEAQCWGTCLPIVTRDAEGEPCGVENELVGDCNPEWLACVDGVCEPKGDGSQGAICDVHQYFNACDEGLDCRSGRCVRVQ